MRKVKGVFVPLIIGVGLPILSTPAIAATTAAGSDADPFWNVVIEPGTSDASLLKRIALQDFGAGEAVPTPAEPGENVPAEEFEQPFAEPAIVPLQGVPTEGTGEFEVLPGNVTPVESEAETDASPRVDHASYQTIYESIPFSRSLYDANPSYRHDATMELLTGNARPAVIHQHDASNFDAYGPPPAVIPPYVYDRYLGQIPTFIQRYAPPMIPFGYPVSW